LAENTKVRANMSYPQAGYQQTGQPGYPPPYSGTEGRLFESINKNVIYCSVIEYLYVVCVCVCERYVAPYML